MNNLMPVFFLLVTSASFAQNDLLTDVSFNHPEKFTDFETRIGFQDRRDRLKKDLTKNIQQVWSKIFTNGDVLSISFTDIDMAGRFLFGINQIRQVRLNRDRSVLEFDYTIKNKVGEIIKSGHEKIIENNLAHLDRYSKAYIHTRLKYEVALITKWMQGLSQPLG